MTNLLGIYGTIKVETDKAICIKMTYKECNGIGGVWESNQYDIDMDLWIAKSQIVKHDKYKFVVKSNALQKKFIDNIPNRKANYFIPLSFKVFEVGGIYKFYEVNNIII